MDYKRQRRARPPIGNPDDPDGFMAYLARYIVWMHTQNYAKGTTYHREDYLRWFISWCDQRGLTQPREITKPILERYQRHLYHHRKTDGEPLSFRSQHLRLSGIRVFFKWLTRNNHILYNPASEISLPKIEKRLPRHVLTQNEAEQVLNQPDIHEPIGLRDRAILETLYSTGMRRMELINLKLYDVDAERGTVLIRQGKGKKDRMIPIGERALAWINKYLDEVRPQWLLEPDDGTLFLTQYGEPFSTNRLTQVVRVHVQSAKLGKSGSCHLFRHTMATLMLENGCDIRFIQAMLGHAELSTTQIYTQVSIRKLKEVHSATHPAKLQRHTTHAEIDAATQDALWATLDHEAEEDDTSDVAPKLDATQ